MTDAEDTTAGTEEGKKPSKVKKIGLFIIIFAVGLMAGKMFLGGGGGGTTVVVKSATTTKVDLLEAPTIKLNPVTANLAANHYAKATLAVTLDPTAVGKEAKPADMVDKFSPLNDALLSYLGGRTVAEVTAPGFIEKMKEYLDIEAETLFEGKVVKITVPEFVAQ